MRHEPRHRILATCVASLLGCVGSAPSSQSVTEAGSGAAALACPAGTRVRVERKACSFRIYEPSPALVSVAKAAVRGEVLPLDGLQEDWLGCTPSLVCAPAKEPDLLFSDRPEYVPATGVLYADTVVAGRHRLFLHHVNDSSSRKKISVVLWNGGSATATVVMTKRGVGGPTGNILQIGRDTAKQWLGSSIKRTVSVPAKKRVVLDADMDGRVAAPGQLIHAIFDFTTDAPIKVSVVSLAAGTNTVSAAGGLEALPPGDEEGHHQRGTFLPTDRQAVEMVIVTAAPPPEDGARHLRLGGDTTDPDLVGTDALLGTRTTLAGNFGASYRLEVEVPTATAFAVSARGGKWTGAARVSAGVDHDAELLLLPYGGSFIESQAEAVSLGRFAAGSHATIELFTAGGSNMPIDVVMIPLSPMVPRPRPDAAWPDAGLDSQVAELDAAADSDAEDTPWFVPDARPAFPDAYVWSRPDARPATPPDARPASPPDAPSWWGPDPAKSCDSRCGTSGPGCSCEPNCRSHGNCCSDVELWCPEL